MYIYIYIMQLPASGLKKSQGQNWDLHYEFSIQQLLQKAAMTSSNKTTTLWESNVARGEIPWKNGGVSYGKTI